MAILCFVLVGVGVLLILLGAYMSLKEWQKKLDEHPKVKEQAPRRQSQGLGEACGGDQRLSGRPAAHRLGDRNHYYWCNVRRSFRPIGW